MSDRGKIGLFGGSFDPIHTGHLILAQAAMDFIGLGKVLFIPTAVPPHKRREDITDFKVRKEMVELAIADNAKFELSFLEGEDKISYTYESVMHLKKKGFSREHIHLLIGSDSLMEIRSWRKPEVIFSNATMVVLRRPGYEGIPALPQEAAVIMIERGGNLISSSEIRELVGEARSIRYLVPRSVENFISDHSLYRRST